MSTPILELKNVSKHYQLGDTLIKALDNVSFSLHAGEFVAVMGPSGSGKSTFLQVASILATPTLGEVFLNNKNVTEYTEVEAAGLRNKEIGFIFQSFNLLARTSALDNVGLPLVYSDASAEERNRRAQELLEEVGLGDRLQNTPAQLSGGQQQRVAVARALVNNPLIIFADEPTGNLDTQSGNDILRLLKDFNKQSKTIIMVTHEDEVAAIAKRQVRFLDGKIISDSGVKAKRTPTKQKKKKSTS